MAQIDMIDTIARQIADAFNRVKAKDENRQDANKALTEASQDAGNERIATLVALSAASLTANWTIDDTSMAVDRAVAQRNAKDNTIATFAAEIKSACHPSVRAHVPTMFDLATDAWDAEGEARKADKKAPTPLRKAFARKYHLVVGRMFKEAIGGRLFADTQELVEYALARDPDLDYTKVHKRLLVIRGQLANFAKDFPVQGLQDCVEFLDAIDVKELKACRERDAEPEAPTPEVEAAPAQELAEGASDILDEALKGTVA